MNRCISGPNRWASAALTLFDPHRKQRLICASAWACFSESVCPSWFPLKVCRPRLVLLIRFRLVGLLRGIIFSLLGKASTEYVVKPPAAQSARSGHIFFAHNSSFAFFRFRFRFGLVRTTPGGGPTRSRSEANDPPTSSENFPKRNLLGRVVSSFFFAAMGFAPM